MAVVEDSEQQFQPQKKKPDSEDDKRRESICRFYDSKFLSISLLVLRIYIMNYV